MKMKMNTNDRALVKLTKDGVAQHVAHFESIGKTEKDAAESLRRASVDDGRHRFQIWELMAIFGDQMYHGNTKKMFTKNAIEFVHS